MAALGVAGVCAASNGGASAADVGLPRAPAPIQADSRCASRGQGYFAVAGSSACVRISGSIGAGVNFGPGARALAGGELFPAASSSGPFADVGAAVDAVFDTDYGPARLSIGVGRLRDAR